MVKLGHVHVMLHLLLVQLDLIVGDLDDVLERLLDGTCLIVMHFVEQLEAGIEHNLESVRLHFLVLGHVFGERHILNVFLLHADKIAEATTPLLATPRLATSRHVTSRHLAWCSVGVMLWLRAGLPVGGVS